MEAILYRILIYGGGLEFVHGMGETIWELYIPQIGTVVNEHGGCFKSESRAKGEVINVEVDYDYVRAVEARAVSNDSFSNINNKYFDNVKEKYKDKVQDTFPKHIRDAIEKSKTTFATTATDDEPLVIKQEDT